VSKGVKGVLDEREAAKSGVTTVTHTAAPDLFDGEAGPLFKARPMGGRAGRPNRRTAEMASFIQRTMGDPLHELARLAMCDPLELVREMNAAQAEAGGLVAKNGSTPPAMTINEALYFKKQCLEAILPYVHARRAQENEQGEAVKPEIVVNLGGLDPAALKIAPGGLDAGGFMDLSRVVADGQERYALSSEAKKAEQIPDGASDDSE